MTVKRRGGTAASQRGRHLPPLLGIVAPLFGLIVAAGIWNTKRLEPKRPATTLGRQGPASSGVRTHPWTHCTARYGNLLKRVAATVQWKFERSSNDIFNRTGFATASSSLRARVATAESSYRQHGRNAVSRKTFVRAMNDLVEEAGLPNYFQTSEASFACSTR